MHYRPRTEQDRADRLEAAYEELMNDDDFEEMMIDNETTVHVDKTVGQSNKTRTDRSSRTSTVSSERTGTGIERVNFGEADIERHSNVGDRGDYSRKASCAKNFRTNSPVPGTSKDDSESPVIPVVQAGTKVCSIF